MPRRKQPKEQPDYRQDYWDFLYSEYQARLRDRAHTIKQWIVCTNRVLYHPDDIDTIMMHANDYMDWVQLYEQPGDMHQQELVYKRGAWHKSIWVQLDFLTELL